MKNQPRRDNDRPEYLKYGQNRDLEICNPNGSSEYARSFKVLYDETSTDLVEANDNTSTDVNPRPGYNPLRNVYPTGDPFLLAEGANVVIPESFEGKKLRFQVLLNDAEWAEFFEVKIFVDNAPIDITVDEISKERQDWREICINVRETKTIKICGSLTDAASTICRQRVSFTSFIEVLAVQQEEI